MALLFMGIIFGALGITFLFVGQSMTDITGVFTMLGFTFTPIGVLLFVIGIVLMRGAGRQQQLLQTGLPGMATVTALSDTGVTVNDSPLANISFLVQVPGRPPYPVQKRMTLPRLMVGRVAPGMSLPVRVDPANPQEIVIAWDQPNPMAGDLGALMSGAYGQTGGTSAGAYGVPDASASGGFPGPGATAPGYGAAPAGWGTPQGFMSIPTTVIDASGGGQPVVLSAGGGLDQATLDRINRALYEHGLGGAALGAGALGGMAAAAPAAGAPSGASPQAATPGFGLLDPKQAERLSAVGYSGRATIDSFQDTGVATGDTHLYTFGLTVHVEGRPDQAVRHAAMVPERAVGRIVSGATLPVRVDPLDTSQLLVEWDNG